MSEGHAQDAELDAAVAWWEALSPEARAWLEYDRQVAAANCWGRWPSGIEPTPPPFPRPAEA